MLGHTFRVPLDSHLLSPVLAICPLGIGELLTDLVLSVASIRLVPPLPNPVVLSVLT